MIIVLRAPMEKLDNVQEQTNMSIQMKTLIKNQNKRLEIKYIATKINNMPTRRVDTAKERISALGDMSLETFQIEMQRENGMGKKMKQNT